MFVGDGNNEGEDAKFALEDEPSKLPAAASIIGFRTGIPQVGFSTPHPYLPKPLPVAGNTRHDPLFPRYHTKPAVSLVPAVSFY